MYKKHNRKVARGKIHRRIRKNMFGTSERPRLCVYRSLNNIYAQIIDDQVGKTLVTASTLDPSIKNEIKNGSNKEAAKKVGVVLAEKAKAQGVKKVVFDRNGFKYHGRIAALADGAREKGLDF